MIGIEKVQVGGIPVHTFTVDTLHQVVSEVIDSNARVTLLHSNAYLVTLANSREKWMLDYFQNEVDYVYCDGSGISLGSTLKGGPSLEKITCGVWYWDFAKFCESNAYKIFLLGAKEGVWNEAADRLKEVAPNLKLDGHHGYFDHQKDSQDNKNVINKINQSESNILLVCFGMPHQEKWIKENFDQLKVNVIQSGGGALDYLSGKKRSAPRVFSKLYLEWLYRFLREPIRLGKRYTIGLVKYWYYVFK